MTKFLTTFLCPLIFLLSCSSAELKGDTFFDKKGKFSLSGVGDFEIEKKDGHQGQASYHAVGFHKDDSVWIWVFTGESSERIAISSSERVTTIEQAKEKLKAQFGVELVNSWQKKFTIDGVESWGYGADMPSKKISFKSATFDKDDKTYALTLTTTSSIKSDTVWTSLLSRFKFLSN